MDIGTSKPDKELLSRLPHHLIDIKEPDEQYTAGEFVRLADTLCLSLASEDFLPILSGGTGFYVKNFICGPPTGPQSDPGIREEVANDLASKGVDALRQELRTADPALASRIHAKDLYRLTRAIEIWRSSGKKPSSFAPGNTTRKNYRFLIVGIERPREEIKSRIDTRVDIMMQRGLAAEVRSLEEEGFTAEDPGMKAIGYREFFEKPEQGEDAITTLIKLHTRQYAKRQMTFFRSLPGIRWIDPEAEQLSALVRKFLSNGVKSDNGVDSLS
jgi:tRNA dimethylallyltransferase